MSELELQARDDQVHAWIADFEETHDAHFACVMERGAAIATEEDPEIEREYVELVNKIVGILDETDVNPGLALLALGAATDTAIHAAADRCMEHYPNPADVPVQTTKK